MHQSSLEKTCLVRVFFFLSPSVCIRFFALFVVHAMRTTYHILRPKNVKHRYVPTSPNGPKHFSAKGGKNHFKNHDGNIRNMNSDFRFFCTTHQHQLLQTASVFSPNAQQGFPFHSGGWGLRVCSLDAAQPFATVRNRSQPFA